MSVLERVREAGATLGQGREPGSAARLRDARERLKSSLIERLGLATIAGMLSGEEAPRVRSELVVALEAILNTQGFEGLSP